MPTFRVWVDFAKESQQANDWAVERWKEAIRWFFRTAKRARSEGAVEKMQGQDALAPKRGRGSERQSAHVANAQAVGGYADSAHPRTSEGANAEMGDPGANTWGVESARQESGDPSVQTKGARGPGRQPARLETSEPKWKLDCENGQLIVRGGKGGKGDKDLPACRREEAG